MRYRQPLAGAEAAACRYLADTIFSPSTTIDIRAEIFGDWFRMAYVAAVVPILRRAHPIERPGLTERMDLCVTEQADAMLRARMQSYTVWTLFHQVLRRSLADAAFYAAYEI